MYFLDYSITTSCQSKQTSYRWVWNTAHKKFPLRISLVDGKKPQKTESLLSFTEKFLNEKYHFCVQQMRQKVTMHITHLKTGLYLVRIFPFNTFMTEVSII